MCSYYSKNTKPKDKLDSHSILRKMMVAEKTTGIQHDVAEAHV
jgi:hypothetical protein